jgi:predicted lipid-binding transport protein (Tim44 family)
MLRTILMTGVMVMFGIFALGFVFKIFGGLIALTFLLLGFAIKALLVGGVAYIIIRIVSPDTARRLRDSWSGSRVDRY